MLHAHYSEKDLQSSCSQKQASSSAKPSSTPPDITESAETFHSNIKCGVLPQIITIIVCGLIGGGIAALSTGDAERFWVGFAMGAIFLGLMLALQMR